MLNINFDMVVPRKIALENLDLIESFPSTDKRSLVDTPGWKYYEMKYQLCCDGFKKYLDRVNQLHLLREKGADLVVDKDQIPEVLAVLRELHDRLDAFQM